MTRFVLRRLAVSLLLLVLASIVIFVALRVIPGDPTDARASRAGVTAEQVAQIRRELGLDRSIASQYVTWIGGVAHGDFGESFFSAFSTTELISSRIGPSAELALAATVVGLLLAVPAALLCALRPDSWLDRTVSAGAAAGIAVPPFLLAILFVSVFAIQLGWLPTRGYVSPSEGLGEHLRYLVLPALTMGIVIAAPILRFMRASLRDELAADYVRTAEGKGLLRRQAIVRHALPNGVLPTLTFLGMVVGSMLGGIVVIEYVFGWKGLGALAVDAVGKRDYAVLQGVVLLAAAAFVVTSLVVDLLSMLIDPRLRRQAAAR